MSKQDLDGLEARVRENDVLTKQQDKVVAGVDAMLRDQEERLRKLAEEGAAAPVSASSPSKRSPSQREAPSPRVRAAAATAARRQRQRSPRRQRTPPTTAPQDPATAPRDPASASREFKASVEADVQVSNDTPVEDEPAGVGEDATIRYLRAQLKVLRDDKKQTTARIKVLEGKVSSGQSSLRKVKEESAKVQRELQKCQAQLDKAHRTSREGETRVTELERQVATLESELKVKGRSAKQAEDAGNSKDVRLNRALEEIERYRGLVKRLQSAEKDTSAELGREKKSMEAELRRVEGQKAELLAAFRKQLKLIDVLKRQKLHIEAAKMLSFTEEEFKRALEAS